MKILAWSDWRIQSLAMLRGIIRKENPDLLLYAGDDLDRLIGTKDKIYFKTYNNFIEVDLQQLEDLLHDEKLAENPKIKEVVLKFKKGNFDFLAQFDIPLIYVNGNDDLIIKINGVYYLRIIRRLWIHEEWHIIYENEEGKIDIIPFAQYRDLRENTKYIKKVLGDQKEYEIISNPKEIKKFLRNEELYELSRIYGQDDIYYKIKKERAHIDPFLRYTRDNGIYVKISPTCGKTSFNTAGESLTIFGSGCSFGIRSKLIRPLDEYADIFLSHLPPLGKLDLAARFGINHIGSTELLEAIHKYNPKFVICGHSHIWGGEVEKINNTVILNVSSQDNPRYSTEGMYAIINTDNWSYHMKKERMEGENIVSLENIRGYSTFKKKLREKGRIYIPNKDLGEVHNKFLEKFEGLMGLNTKRRLFYIDVGLLERKKPTDQKKITKLIRKELGVEVSTYREANDKAKVFYDKLYKVRTFHEAFEVLEELENFGIGTSQVKERIMALRKGTPKVIRSITFNPREYFFVDVETGLAQGNEPGRLWLIGIGNGQKKKIKQFLYPQELTQFLMYLRKNDVDTLVSWTQYDQKVLRPLLESHDIIMSYYDACQRTANCLSWHTYSLHDLYNALFPDNKTPPELIPGRIAGLYADHMIFDKTTCPHCSKKKEKIIKEIIKRNKLDVKQMIDICELLYKEEIYECPDCGFKTKYKDSLTRHIENKTGINRKP